MIELIIGAGIVAFLLFYHGGQFNPEEHFAIRLLLFSLGIVMLLLVGKGTIDSKTVCEPFLNMTNTTVSGSSNITTYDYSTICYEKTTSVSAKILYRSTLWIFILYMTYVMYFFVYWMFSRVTDWLKKGRRGWKKK